MTVPDPGRPRTGMDPMPTSRPRTPLTDPLTDPLPDDVPDPARPGRPARPGTDGLLELVAPGRQDGRRHVVDVPVGELGDPEGLRGRCGAPVTGVVPGLGAGSADCPVCVASAAGPP